MVGRVSERGEVRWRAGERVGWIVFGVGIVSTPLGDGVQATGQHRLHLTRLARITKTADQKLTHSFSKIQEVASLLLQRGTLPFAQLLRLTSLPPAILHKSLLILSLHQCLYHSETETNNHLTELYEINSTGIEHRMRGAIYAEMVEKDFSEGGFEGAREVVEGFWREGMGRVEEVVEKVSGKILVEREVRGVLREAREGAKEKEREPKVGEKRKGKSKAQLTDGGIDGGESLNFSVGRLGKLTSWGLKRERRRTRLLNDYINWATFPSSRQDPKLLPTRCRSSGSSNYENLFEVSSSFFSILMEGEVLMG